MVAQSAGAVEYTDCIPAERQDYPNECPDMTLHHQMVRLQSGQTAIFETI